jgi:hypothetical protein
MIDRFITMLVRAEDERDLAFCCSFTHPDYGVRSGLWIPKSNMSGESLEVIETAAPGDMIEIDIAKWWMDKQV